MFRFRKSLSASVAACCVLMAAPGLANAGTTTDKGWTNYHGKTRGGQKISFASRGKYLSLIETRVPVICGSGQGGVPRGSETDFSPPFSEVFKANGREDQIKVEDGSSPTTYYTVKARRHGKRISGSLRMSWSLLSSDGYGGYKVLICQGTTTFSAKGGKTNR
jgi:hypothetical protein